MNPRASRAHGFTLIELVVVLAIFAVIAVMAYGGLRSVLDTRRAVEKNLTRTSELQRAYMRLRQDLQQMRRRPVRDVFGDEQPVVFGNGNSVEFTRGGWRNPLLHARGTLERVAYRVNGDGDLVRSSWRVLDRAQDTEPVEIVVLAKVDAASWRFLGEGTDWIDGWPGNDETGGGESESALSPVPRAVELRLETRDWGELSWRFRTGIDGEPPPAPANSGIPPGGEPPDDEPPEEEPPEEEPPEERQ